MSITKLDEYERWAVGRLRALLDMVESEECVGMALVILRRHDVESGPKIRMHRMSKAGEGHRLLGALHELAHDIAAELSATDYDE